MSEQQSDSMISIYFPDLVHYVLEKWKWMILLSVIGIIVGFAYGKHEALQNVGEEQEASNQAVMEEIARSTLSDTERNQVDTAYQSYLNMVQVRDKQQDYLDHSLLMNLPYDGVPTEVLYYTAGAGFAQEIYQLVISTLENRNFYRKAAAALGNNYTEAYMSELISTDIVDTSVNVVLIPGDVSIMDEKVPSSVISITFTAMSEEDCSKCAELAQNELNKTFREAEDKTSKYKIQYLTSQYQEKICTDLLAERQNITSNIIALTEKLANFTDSYGFTEAQSSYFSRLVQSGGQITSSEGDRSEKNVETDSISVAKKTDESTVQNTGTSGSTENEITSVADSNDWIRLAICDAAVGSLAGIVVITFLAIFVYIMDGKVHCLEQIEAFCPIILEFAQERKWGRHYKSLSWALQENNLAVSESIFLALDCSVRLDDPGLLRICQFLEEKSFTVITGTLGQGAKELVQMKNADAILMIGKANITIYENFKQEAKMINPEKTLYLGCTLL